MWIALIVVVVVVVVVAWSGYKPVAPHQPYAVVGTAPAHVACVVDIPVPAARARVVVRAPPCPRRDHPLRPAQLQLPLHQLHPIRRRGHGLLRRRRRRAVGGALRFVDLLAPRALALDALQAEPLDVDEVVPFQRHHHRLGQRRGAPPLLRCRGRGSQRRALPPPEAFQRVVGRGSCQR